MNPFYGVREHKTRESDYKMGWTEQEMDIPEPENKYSGIQYNQYDVAANSCTVHGALGVLSDATGVVFDLAERKYLWEKALERGANNDWGWYINEAVKLVADYWNGVFGDKPATSNKVIYYRTALNTPEASELLDRGYSLNTGYRGNWNYNQDAWGEGDCKLNATANIGTTTYGHSVRIMRQNGKNYVVDNYLGRQCNVYEIGDVAELTINRLFYPDAYCYVTKNAIDKMNEEKVVSDWAKDAVAKCKTKGIAIDWKNPREIVCNNVAEIMFNRAGILNVNTGTGVSKERLAVILDRLHLLD
jgi:hypothetical protein